MLAASQGDMEDLASFEPLSTSAPRQRDIPKPNNWSGVAAGIAAAKKAIGKKDLTLAEQHLRETLEFAPAQAEAWHILAAILRRQGQLEEAKDCLRRTLKLKQKHQANTEALSVATLPTSQRMAKLMWSQGDHDAALTMLNTLLISKPADEKNLALQQLWTTAITKEQA